MYQRYQEMRDKDSKSYHKLILWQKLKELLKITYELTGKLPSSEEFGLKSQMRRANVSVISNFVEGYMKKSIKEKLHFMEISETSLLELEAQSEVCMMLGYLKESEFEMLDNKRGEVGYFLYRYRISVK
jgi:four helix bundle protein